MASLVLMLVLSSCVPPCAFVAVDKAQAVEGDQDGGAHVGEHGHPQREQAAGDEHEGGGFDEQRYGDVLLDDGSVRRLKRTV